VTRIYFFSNPEKSVLILVTGEAGNFCAICGATKKIPSYKRNPQFLRFYPQYINLQV
jgi:hypothetical protein